MADSKNMVIKIVSDAKDFVKGMEDALRQIQSASQKAQSFDKIAEDAANLKEQLSKVAENLVKVESAAEAGSSVTDAQIEKLQNNFENLNKKFDSFRHTFGDMQEKLNGLSTRTLQVQLDKANDSLKAFRENYSSWQKEISAGLSINKNVNEISNIYEMKKAYEDSLTVYKNFSETRKKNTDGNFSKEYLQAAANVYKYGDALIELNSLYNKNNKGKPPLINGDSLDKIDDKLFDTGKIIGQEIAEKIENEVESSLGNIDINTFFKKITGQVKAENLIGAYKGKTIEIPVKIDPKAFSNLENEINKDISSLQSKANANPIKINYKTDTEALTKNIEKYFKELNTKLKNQVTELNTLMKGLVDDTGLKKTEQDFSSMAKLIPEMLRKVVEYSEQLKTVTTDTKNSFENVNNFVKEENFINYANAIKETVDSFKLLTSSLDDVSSKLSGNGLEGQFDLLKKKFSEISVDSFLNKEDSKKNDAERKAKLKEIRELFALYSTYQSRGGIRPFSDLISGESNVDKKAYLQLAYNNYTKDQKKKGNIADSTPFDAKQLKDILQILKDIKTTIENISKIKIDTSELAKTITEIQGTNTEKIFTPQVLVQIWQTLTQYANNYSESLSKVIEKLEIISQKNLNSIKFDPEETKKTYTQIENIVQLLEKGFGISLNPDNQLRDNIQDITESNQVAVESNQKLADSMKEVAQAAQEEKEAIIDPAVRDYLIKWINMVKGTKAYSGLEEKGIALKGTNEIFPVRTGKLHYERGHVGGGVNVSGFENKADTLLHSHTYSEEVDNLRFSWADLKTGFETIVQIMDTEITKMFLSCGDEIASIDVTGMSAETANLVEAQLYEMYNSALVLFGGEINNKGVAGKIGISNELMNEATNLINTLMKGIIEQAGGKVNFYKLVDNKLIDTTSSRANYQITPEIGNRLKEIQTISNLDITEATDKEIAQKLREFQINNNIKTNTSGLLGLSKEELKEIDQLLLQILNHKQQLENTKSGSQTELIINEKIAEAERRISEITKRPFLKKQDLSEVEATKPKENFDKKDSLQEEIRQEEQATTQAKQSIIDSINEIKNVLDGLKTDLEVLAKTIISLGDSTENTNYVNRLDSIKKALEDILDIGFSIHNIDYRKNFDGVQENFNILNETIQNLAETIGLLDFEKINDFKIPLEPFEEVINSLKEIIDLTERVSGIPSKSNLDNQFENIRKIYSSLINDKGNFIVTKNKDAVQDLFSQYNRYIKFGGTKTLTDLDGSKSNVNKLSKYYNKYLDNISQQNESETVVTNSLKDEAQKFIGIKEAANEATVSKESFIKANKKLETQTDKTSKSLEQEKTQFETFINDVKTLVATDIKSNNIVDFNTEILNSSKEANEALKEELQQLQQLSEIQKSNPTKQSNNRNNFVSRATSSKNQNTDKEVNKQVESFQKSDIEFNYEDLGRSYDPYLDAFQDFLLLAAEEAEKVKEQIISVAEFDQSLSDILTNLYAEIPDLEDISASTGYGKNFNVTGATVSYRDKTTNDTYRKSFSLRQDKDSGEFYIDQTTSILNDAEKYGKDNAKLQQQIKLWKTQLDAWLQSFSNKTSGTLDKSSNFEALKNFVFTSKDDWVEIKGIQQELEGLYNEIVSNSRRGISSLSPVPNMMANQGGRLTKKEKAESIYDKMVVKWNGAEGVENTENELIELSRLYDVLQNEVTQFIEDGTNVDSMARAYGDFNEQLNKVNEQLNRIKIINTEINGNKINNLNNWFKDMPNPNEIRAENLGKIEKYSEVYNQFVDLQNRLQSLTTNLSRNDDDYNDKKQQIHEITLELDQMKKVLSSDRMNLTNQTGAIIKQNLPEVNDVRELDNVVNEYIKDLGVLQDSTNIGLKADKEGNEFATLTRKIKDSQGVITEFEFTYDKAMGTITVATKKIQQPESLFKQITDELTTKWRGLFTTLASFASFYRLWGYFKQGINTVREFDSALTEMQKVSDETISTLQQYQKTTFDTADAIGVTALQIQNSTADFMRLGESLKEAAESAKVANILMNVSEFESINEATKSLIAMSAAYDDLSKMNIIDKLNEVGNNYAISTSEAATALQNSASALKTAGNNMDESLALITAGNAVVQDANKVGTGMRTIALRLTGTKSAKEQLEEMGEETENVITTQSKLRDTIKEATAVGSNEFKGFDILDDNGNYKSTYEIMLGIAEVYDEILETDKQLGRNNANLLLESVAGKTRANIAASIFQNPELLKEAYKSSQEAENSAMEENEKYMNSINGHIAQLQNAYQQLWANSMNRDTVNYFIDLGKSILKVVDDVGLLGTAFVGIASIKSIVGYQNGKGFAYDLIKGSKKVIENLAKQEGALGSLASTAVSAGQTVGGAFSSAIPIIGGVTTAVGLAAVGINAFIQYQKRMRKELVDSANSTGNNWQEQKQSLSDYISQYEALKKKLDSENLSEQETIETKQQIFDIQKQITEQYGNNAEGIDLINGKLQDQLNIINNISQAEANRIWQSEKYQEGFNISQEEMLNPKALKIYGEGTTKEVQNILNNIFGQKSNESFGTGSFTSYYQTSGDIYKNRKQLEDAIAQIEKLKNEIPQEEIKAFDGILVQLRRNLDKVNEVINENEANYLNGLQIKLSANNSKGYSIFENYQSSVSSLEDAYITGNTQKIQEARKAYIDATIEKNKFLNNDDYNKNKEFDALFKSIDTSIIEKKNQYADVAELLSGIVAPEENRSLLKQEEDKNDLYKDNSKALRKYTDSEKKVRKEAERLYKLNPDRIDIEGTLLDNTYASGKYANALNSLQNALGWSADDAQSLVDILIDAGIVQGSAADMADYSADSYGNFSSSVEGAINALSVLNTVMSESYSGQGITDQTLDQFKQTFGEGAYQALEKTANGYHINAQEAYSLRKQQEALVDTDYSSALSQQYNALNKLNEGYRKAIRDNEDTSAFAEQRKVIENNITKLQDRMMAFNNANSAYQTWLANQSNNGERQMYESIYGGFDAIKDEFEHGWAGIKTRSWMDLVLGDESEADFDVWDAQATELKERYDQLSKDIEGTGGYSIKDFFTADDNGKITSKGVMNFFKALENKQKEVLKEGEKGFINLEEGWFDFTNGGDQRVADLFGIDIEAVDAILRAAAEAGAEVKLDQPIFSAERIEEEAIKAKTSLEKDLGGELNINLNPESIEEANLDMAKLTEYRDKLASDTSLEPTVKTKRLEELSDIMSYISTKEREIVENNIIDFEVKNTDLIKADKEISSIFSGLEHYSDRFGKRTDGIDKILSVDPSTLNDLNSLKDFYGTVREAKLTPEVNDEQVAMLDALLKAIEDKINAINNKPVEGQSLSFSQYEQGLKTITQINDTIKKAKESGADFEFNWEGDEEFMSLVEFIDGLDTKQKMQLGLDPDINTQQILEIAKNGGTIELGVESNTTPAQLTTPQPQTKQELQQVITTELRAHDSASPTIEEASKSAWSFGKTYTAELEAKDNASKEIEKPQKAADKFGKTESRAKLGVDGTDSSNAAINAVRSSLLNIPNKISSSINIDVFGAGKISNALDDLSKLRNAARNNIHLNITKANGTAHAQGTAFSRGSIISGNAFAGGKWGISKNQTALTGELGTEIVVRDGNWFTVGEDGAEFVNLQKGDIVFNHKQAQELLENGYVTSNKGRGRLVGFANGSAFASGSAYDGGSTGSTLGMLNSTADKKATGKTTSNNKDTSKGKTTPKTTDKEANKTKNTLDEVEILIARIERQIANLDKTISSTYKTWSTRNTAIKSDLTKVAKEIKEQSKAYTTYMRKANSIQIATDKNADGSTKSAKDKKKQSDTWKKRIQNGQQIIRDISNQDVWDKIQEYKQW